MAGNIKVILPKDNYQKVAKSIIFNESVDALTLGVYVKVLCLGQKWELNVRGLAEKLHISQDKIRRIFATLEETGYLRRQRAHGSGGKFSGWDYEVSSEPFTDIAKTPTSVNTDIGKTPTSVKCPCIDRDIETINRDIDSSDREKREVACVPSRDEVLAYAKDRGIPAPEDFADYYYESQTANGWMTGKGKNRKPVDNWKLNVLAWKRYWTPPPTTDPTTRLPSRPYTKEEINKMLTQ